jgi:putative acetyltransferase
VIETLRIRRERTPDDVEGVHEVHRQAFAPAAAEGAEPIEVGLLRSLRRDAGWVPRLSWVAEDADGTVVGHVVCTEGRIGDAAVLGLGPIGVIPSHQGRHIGHGLMRSVLAAADALDYPLVVLLGHLDYYPRFGFVPASTLGIVAPDPAWGTHFQARTLATYTPELTGEFTYAAPFSEL